MSNKACCVKIKNCSGKLGGMFESQMFLIETAPKEIGEKLEAEINALFDEAITRAEKLEAKLFEVK